MSLLNGRFWCLSLSFSLFSPFASSQIAQIEINRGAKGAEVKKFCPPLCCIAILTANYGSEARERPQLQSTHFVARPLPLAITHTSHPPPPSTTVLAAVCQYLLKHFLIGKWFLNMPKVVPKLQLPSAQQLERESEKPAKNSRKTDDEKQHGVSTILLEKFSGLLLLRLLLFFLSSENASENS